MKLHLRINFGEPNWSYPIEGIGGSKLIEKEKNGLHNNDEGWKMATTDALGTACKYIGLAADVYLGGGKGPTGSKYDRDKPPRSPRQRPKEKPPAPSKEQANPTPKWNDEALKKYADKLMENWVRDGYSSTTKFGRDTLGFLVYCKRCLGPVNVSTSSHPRAPEFVCMGFGSDVYCSSIDGQGKVVEDTDGKPFRLGWWKGEWYSAEHGGWPYSGIKPEKPVGA
ncbi:MAG: hypothetical protein V3W28_08290 [Thermoplasmata archaeon]